MSKINRPCLCRTYMPKEWKKFFPNKLRYGAFHYLVYYLSEKKEIKIPGISITNQKIWIAELG